MMFIFAAAFVLVCLRKVKVTPSDNNKYMTDYMSVEKTTAIKGIFILIVFLSHFNSYVDFTNKIDIAYSDIVGAIGQRMVTLFMFYSGFGVMESIKRKKMTYIKQIPVTRVLGTLFRFDIAVIIFAVINIIINHGPTFNLSRLLLSLIGWSSIGNSSWYIFSIVICYIATYAGFIIFKDKKNYCLSAVSVAVIICMFIVVMKVFNLNGLRYYNTVICYAIGVFFSLYKDKIEKIFVNNKIVWGISFFATLLLNQMFYILRRYFICQELSMILFTIAVVLLTMRVSFNNKALQFCGKHLFGIYIMQRIPMIIFKQLGINDFNIYLYFIICLAVTLPLAYYFELLTGKLWNLIIKKH